MSAGEGQREEAGEISLLCLGLRSRTRSLGVRVSRGKGVVWKQSMAHRASSESLSPRSKVGADNR